LGKSWKTAGRSDKIRKYRMEMETAGRFLVLDVKCNRDGLLPPYFFNYSFFSAQPFLAVFLLFLFSSSYHSETLSGDFILLRDGSGRRRNINSSEYLAFSARFYFRNLPKISPGLAFF
jgi:hypothetical protein